MPNKRIPRVSIVIVNYNGKHLLERLISSIKKSRFTSKEIIVLDNDSSDGSVEFLKGKFKDVIIVKNETNLGYSGINSSIKHCRGNYILFLNNDMELDKECLGIMIKSIESDKNIAMVAPKLINFYQRGVESAGTWLSRSFYCGHIKGPAKNPEVEIPYMGVGLIRKDFVEKFGYLFDPDYFIYAEDLDLGLRIRLCGLKCIFAPKAIMYHMHAVTAQKVLKSKTTYLMERNLLFTFFKNLSMGNILLFLSYVFFMRLVAVLKDIIALRFDNALSRIKAMIFIIFNFGFVIRKRKETQKFRKADDRYILKVFSEKYIFKKKFIV